MKRLALTAVFTMGVTGLCGGGLAMADMSMSSGGGGGASSGGSGGASVGGFSGAPESTTKGKASGSKSGLGAPTVVSKGGTAATVASKAAPAPTAARQAGSTAPMTVASKPVKKADASGPAWNVPDDDGRRRL